MELQTVMENLSCQRGEIWGDPGRGPWGCLWRIILIRLRKQGLPTVADIIPWAIKKYKTNWAQTLVSLCFLTVDTL